MDVKALYELQKVDTAIEQGKVALEKLPERSQLQSAIADLAGIRRRRAEMRAQQQAMENELTAIEKASAGIDTHHAKLERQMKTIIAAREAEALQHEMQTLETQRNELDDRGLLLLETSAATDDELRQLALAETDAVSNESLASAALANAADRKTAEIGVLQEQRLVVVITINETDMATYNRLCASYKGIAVAVIQHGVCSGCHMDISVSELDLIKRLPADQTAECPNCNRLLVR
ncbi:MAG: C4-type zinc ribbon domain-containing protein [Actinobacteria bacterium]|nr:C4-type zinc ribbon domain-containing protein [Actinomycetota bacterium]